MQEDARSSVRSQPARPDVAAEQEAPAAEPAFEHAFEHALEAFDAWLRVERMVAKNTLLAYRADLLRFGQWLADHR